MIRDSLNLKWGLLAFMEERGKENNTYFIDVFIIENVEVRLIENGRKKHRDIVRLHVCLC